MEDILELERGFGAEDCASQAMRREVDRWFALYYDAGQLLRLPYTIVRKLVRAVFAEYQGPGELPERRAMELAMIGGESYLKFTPGGWRVLPRNGILIFARDHRGEPVDVGMTECRRFGDHWFTLLERRTLDGGTLTVTNRLFRSKNQMSLGTPVSLKSCAAYADLPARFVWPMALDSVGIARLVMPMANCVDGSQEGVSVYAAAGALVDAIEENERQLQGEFRRGKSRLVVSGDLLRDGKLTDELFVGLDESPESVGITVFAPQLRQESYLQRQQSYLKSMENIIGLKRGLLSEVEAADRTATEITSSEGEFMTTILDFREQWERTAARALQIQEEFGGQPASPEIKWGDGVI